MDKHLKDIEELVSTSGTVEGLLKLLKMIGVDTEKDDCFLWRYVSKPPVKRTEQNIGEQLLDEVLKNSISSSKDVERNSEKNSKDVDIVKSLGGVLEYLVSKSSSTSNYPKPSYKVGLSAAADSSTQMSSENDVTPDVDLPKRSSESNSSVTDFDLIGKEEVASLKGDQSAEKIEQKGNPRSGSWFGFWGSSTSYTPLRNEG